VTEQKVCARTVAPARGYPRNQDCGNALGGARLLVGVSRRGRALHRYEARRASAILSQVATRPVPRPRAEGPVSL